MPLNLPASEKSRLIGCLWFVVILVLLFGIAIGPIVPRSHDHSAGEAMMRSHAICFALLAYADDHNGAYPDGKTSTEVFQKLLDGHYIDDPSVFYLPSAPGKTVATTKKLTASNVCFDVTSGVTKDASTWLPLVYSTGFIVTYVPGANATPDSNARPPFHGEGIAVGYLIRNDNSSGPVQEFRTAAPDGSIAAFVPTTFDLGKKSYRQLRP